jgi:uncharacterized membrane protein YfcA
LLSVGAAGLILVTALSAAARQPSELASLAFFIAALVNIAAAAYQWWKWHEIAFPINRRNEA